MYLLIVESPAKAKTINKYLGNKYKVISSYGHIRGIPSRAQAVDPEKDFATTYEVHTKAEKVLDRIMKSAEYADIIYLATDPDREGEAISWHISEVLEQKFSAIKKRIKRVTFQEITKSAVETAVSNAHDINKNLVAAQQARQTLDYLVGFTLSPILWRKLPGSKSAGRVQSVALRLICDRAKEIRLFEQQEYWTIKGDFFTEQSKPFSTVLHTYHNNKIEKFSIVSEEQAKNIIETIVPDNTFAISDIVKKSSKRTPSPPFTTSTLIQESAHKLGFSAKKTALISQKLYEGVDIGNGNHDGLITYMRTDSIIISNEALIATTEVIEQLYDHDYILPKHRIFKNKNKGAQEAHEAIRPTNVKLLPEEVKKYLNDDEYALYNLIWQRVVASQMASAKLQSTSVIVDIIDKNNVIIGSFKGTGTVVIFDGFYILNKEIDKNINSKKTQLLPDLNTSDIVYLQNLIPQQHFTKPAPHYNEASLVKKMEELGIGRPSTYPNIISILQQREYVEQINNSYFVPTIKGEIVNAFLTCFFNAYVSYKFTAILEENLDSIARGEDYYITVLKEFWLPFSNKAQDIIEMERTNIIKHIEEELADLFFAKLSNKERLCPSCHKGKLNLCTGSFGCFIGCSEYPLCKHMQNLTDATEGTNVADYPKNIGLDKETKKVIYLHKGPYGLYLRLEECKNQKTKNFSIPKNIKEEDLTLEIAMILVHLPKSIGVNKETDKNILIGNGRYGPYLLHDNKYIAIKQPDFWNLTLDEALIIIKNQKASYRNKLK